MNLKNPISIIVPLAIAKALKEAERTAVTDDGAVSISVERTVAEEWLKDLAFALN